MKNVDLILLLIFSSRCNSVPKKCNQLDTLYEQICMECFIVTYRVLYC